MNYKIKECCENCRFYTGKQCDTNGNWYDECSLYADDCSQPCEDFEIAKEARLKQRIAELEAENAELKDHISKSGKMVDVRKLVKPLQWEYDEDDEIYSAPISPRCRKFLQVSVFCEKMKSGYWRVCPNCIVCDRKTAEEAKEAAQDWLVSLVANACGLESEVRK